MNNINISTKQAVNSLFETNLIKVLKTQDGVPGLVTRFLPREEAISLIKDNVVEVTGPEAIKKGYPFSLKDGEDVYFIEGSTK